MSLLSLLPMSLLPMSLLPVSLLPMSLMEPALETCARLETLAWRHRALAPRRAPVHPLVLKAAEGRKRAAVESTGGFVVREGRLGSWANSVGRRRRQACEL